MNSWSRDYLLVLTAFVGMALCLPGNCHQVSPWTAAQQKQVLSWCGTAQQVLPQLWPQQVARPAPSPTSTLVLTTVPGGADVKLQAPCGKTAGSAPGSYQLEKGAVYTLEVNAPGYRAFRRTFRAQGEYYLEVSLSPEDRALTSRHWSDDA